MARIALLAMAGGVWFAWARNDYAVPQGLEDKLWLVFLLPAIYVLSVTLLRE